MTSASTPLAEGSITQGQKSRGSAGGIPERLSQLWDGRAALHLATLRTVLWGEGQERGGSEGPQKCLYRRREGSTGQQPEGFDVEPGKCASLTLHPPASFYTLQQDSDSVPSWVPF